MYDSKDTRYVHKKQHTKEVAAVSKIRSFTLHGFSFIEMPTAERDQLRRMKFLFPHVATGEFSLAVLQEGFYNFSRLLVNLGWLHRAADLVQLHLRYRALEKAIFQKMALPRVKSDGRIMLPKPIRSHAISYWLQEFKLCSNVFLVKSNYMYELMKGFNQWCKRRAYSVERKDEAESQAFAAMRSKGTSVADAASASLIRGACAVSPEMDKVIKDPMGSMASTLYEKFTEGLTEFIYNWPSTIGGMLQSSVDAMGSDLLSSLMDTIRSWFDRVSGIIKKIWTTILPEDYLCGTLPDVITMLLFLVGMYYMRSFMSVAKDVFMTATTFVLQSMGHIVPISWMNTFKNLFGMGTEVESQGFGFTAMALSTLGYLTVYLIDPKSITTLGSFVNIVARAAPLSESIGECIVDMIDYIYFTITKSHLFASREATEAFDSFMTEMLEFSRTPNLQGLIVTDKKMTLKLQDLCRKGSDLKYAMSQVRGPLTGVYLKTYEGLQLLNQFALANAEMYKKRIESILVWFMGSAGQGKTQMLKAFPEVLHNLLQKRYPDEYSDWCPGQTYERVKDSDFWEGYYGQVYCTINELGNMLDEKVRAKEFSEVQKICEDSVLPLNMAFGEKGKAFFRSEVLLTTTNLTNSEIAGLSQTNKTGMTCPLSIIRRQTFPFTVIRKKTIKDDASNADEAWGFVVSFPRSVKVGDNYWRLAFLGMSRFLQISPASADYAEGKYHKQFLKNKMSFEFTYTQAVQAIFKEICYRKEKGYEGTLGSKLPIPSVKEDDPDGTVPNWNKHPPKSDSPQFVECEINFEKEFDEAGARISSESETDSADEGGDDAYDKFLKAMERDKEILAIEDQEEREEAMTKRWETWTQGALSMSLDEAVTGHAKLLDEDDPLVTPEMIQNHWAKLHAVKEQEAPALREMKKAIDDFYQKQSSDPEALRKTWAKLNSLSSSNKHHGEAQMFKIPQVINDYFVGPVSDMMVTTTNKVVDPVKDMLLDVSLPDVSIQDEESWKMRSNDVTIKYAFGHSKFRPNWTDLKCMMERTPETLDCSTCPQSVFGNKSLFAFIWKVCNVGDWESIKLLARGILRLRKEGQMGHQDSNPIGMLEKYWGPLRRVVSYDHFDHDMPVSLKWCNKTASFKTGKFMVPFIVSVLYRVFGYEMNRLGYSQFTHPMFKERIPQICRSRYDYEVAKRIKGRCAMKSVWNLLNRDVKSSIADLAASIIDDRSYREVGLSVVEYFQRIVTETHSQYMEFSKSCPYVRWLVFGSFAVATIVGVIVPVIKYLFDQEEEEPQTLEEVFSQGRDKISRSEIMARKAKFGLQPEAQSLTQRTPYVPQTLQPGSHSLTHRTGFVPGPVPQTSKIVPGSQCFHSSVCKAKIPTSADKCCNTKCGGHNCIHWAECSPGEECESQGFEESMGRANLIGRSMRMVEFVYQNGLVAKAWTLLSGYTVISVAHVLRGYGEHFQYLRILGQNDFPTFAISRENVNLRFADRGELGHGKRDLVFIDMSKAVLGQCYPSIKKYCPSSDDHMCSQKVARVQPYMNGKEFSLFAKTSDWVVVRKTGDLTGSFIAQERVLKTTSTNYLVMHGLEGKAGDCMFPYISVDSASGSAYLEGVHVAGSGGDSFACPIFQSDLEIPEVQSQGFMAQMPVDVYIPEIILNNIDFGGKSTNVPPGGAVFGVFKKGNFIPNKTQFVRSAFQGNGETEPLYELETAPAALTSFMSMDGVVEPLQMATAKNFAVKKGMPMPNWVTGLAASHPGAMSKGFFGHWRIPLERPLRRLTIEEAIFGIPGELDSIDLTTSEGILLRLHHLKRKDVIRLPCGEDPGYIDQLIYDEIAKLEAAVARRELPKLVTIAALKDELRDIERVELGKTRMFHVGDFIHMIWMRMVLGDLMRFLKKHRAQTTGAIGTNPHGQDWKLLFDEMTSHDDMLFGGGDYSGYDTGLRSQFAVWMGVDCAFAYKYGDDTLLFREVLYACISACGPLLIIGRTVFWLEFENPSGGYATGFFNTYCNNCIFAIVFYHLQRKCKTECGCCFSEAQLQEFWRKFYGDDNLWATFKKYAEHWNMLTVSQAITELFGMTYTTPQKGEVKVPFLELEDLEFLKRKFRVVGGSLVYGVLDEVSIRSMLMWIRDTGTYSGNLEQLKVNIGVAGMEMYYYGRPRFEEWRNEIVNACRVYNVNCEVETYDYHHMRFMGGL